ncbi:MAG: NTP transferase domain-containing protein [Caldilineae bacterium]|nr:NTP transferase domain-containing protein [Anaerolineae bacterium]MCB9153107.1 NTP transferase domain-containing protein [Caldilineae bacterium]
MKAVVMAGGAGSRLRPLTVGRPKPMLPLANQGVLGHILTLLSQHGITDVIVTLQYMASVIEDYYGDGSSYGVSIRYVIEDTPLGTAGSVANARQYLDEPFIVISGDALTNFNLSEIIAYHEEKKAEATIVLYHVAEPLDYGVIVTDQEGRVTRFLEKPSWGEVASDTVNTGIYVLDPSVLDRIPANTPYDWASQVFPVMLQSGAPLYGYAAPGYWCDIGNFAEYRRATADLLRGLVYPTSVLGHHIGGDIWVGQDVDIAPDAQLFGPIYLGNEVQIKGGVVIRGPSVVRDYTIVDSRARIDRSIIWRNCYIGEDAELRGAIVSRQCSLRAKSALYEGVVVGDNSIIGEGAMLHTGVKLWPGKEVDPGAVVKSSIIWGSQGRRVLFGRYGVTGVINVDLTPEFAARLGAAFGATLPRGSVVTINRDQNAGSRMLKRAVISGLPSAGVNVQDLQTVPIPVARYYTANSRAAGGVHVRISPFDQRVVDIRFFGSDGMNLSKQEERAIERVFFREDFRRAFMDGIGQISYAGDAIPRYTAAFLATVDQDAIRSAGFNVVVDYAFASTSQVLPDILQHLGVNTTPLGARVDPSYISLDEKVFLAERRRLGVIVSALGSDLGVRLDVGGEKMFLADHTGAQVPEAISCAAMVELVLRTWPGSTVAVPVNQSNVLEQIAGRHGGHVIRTAVDQASIMQTASSADVVLAADGTGFFFFPRFQPVADAMMSVAMLLQCLAQHDVRLLDVVAGLPAIHTVSAPVHCPWDSKGAVMRRLQNQVTDNVQMIDGIKLSLDEERWTLIRPDPDRPLFHVTAEAGNDEEAEELLAEYSLLVEELIQQRA